MFGWTDLGGQSGLARSRARLPKHEPSWRSRLESRSTRAGDSPRQLLPELPRMRQRPPCRTCVSTACASRSRATRLGIASRYGRSDVIALYASATAMMRDKKRDRQRPPTVRDIPGRQPAHGDGVRPQRSRRTCQRSRGCARRSLNDAACRGARPGSMRQASRGAQQAGRSCRCHARAHRDCASSACSSLKRHTLGDVARVDRNRGRMASCVLVTSIERRDQALGEGKVGARSSSFAP